MGPVGKMAVSLSRSRLIVLGLSVAFALFIVTVGAAPLGGGDAAADDPILGFVGVEFEAGEKALVRLGSLVEELYPGQEGGVVLEPLSSVDFDGVDGLGNPLSFSKLERYRIVEVTIGQVSYVSEGDRVVVRVSSGLDQAP